MEVWRLILPGHISSPLYQFLCVVFCRSLFVIFSFGHFIVCLLRIINIFVIFKPSFFHWWDYYCKDYVWIMCRLVIVPQLDLIFFSYIMAELEIAGANRTRKFSCDRHWWHLDRFNSPTTKTPIMVVILFVFPFLW